MKLELTLPALLAIILLTLTNIDDASARPLKRGAPITLPLKRIQSKREGLHPQIVRRYLLCSKIDFLIDDYHHVALAATHQPCAQTSCSHEW